MRSPIFPRSDGAEKCFAPLLENIPFGEQNAVSMRELAVFFGITERELRERIFEARKEGCLILGGVNGYFRPGTLEEVERYYHSTLSRLKSAVAVLKPLQAVLEDAERAGQLTIFEELPEECDQWRNHGRE